MTSPIYARKWGGTLVNDGNRRVPEDILVEIADRRVDAVFAAMMRHHVPLRHHGTLLRYCEGGFALTQIGIVIGLMAGDDDLVLHADDMAGEWSESKGELTLTDADLGQGLIWRSGCLQMPAPTTSETIRTGLAGRPLSSLVDHPYLPGDLTISMVQTLGIQREKWSVSLLLPGEEPQGR